MKIDHVVVNVDGVYQNDTKTIENIRANKLPYEPKWGKGTRGFKVSDLWIGNEYLEMVRILKKDGGGWVREWTEKYNEGHRGMICFMIDVENIDAVYQSLIDKGIQVTSPEWLEFKWCFQMLTRRMPWRNCYVPFFDGVPFQIGFQEMKDEKARAFMDQYMLPNARENGIDGIYQVNIKGRFTNEDFMIISAVFKEKAHEEKDSIRVVLNDAQEIRFQKDDVYQVALYTNTEQHHAITIENLTIHC